MTNNPNSHRSDPAAGRGPMPVWQKVMLAGSIVLMLISGGMYGYGYATVPQQPPPAAPDADAAPPDPDRPPSERPDPPPPGFLPDDRDWPQLPRLPWPDEPDPDAQPAPDDQPPTPGDPLAETPTDTERRPIDRWSPVIFTFGFSFFAGFCIGYAARMFLKLAVILIGLGLVGLFGLQYAGLIDVDWSTIAGGYEDVLAWLGPHTAGFRGFIMGQLPAAALAALGLFAGFRRR